MKTPVNIVILLISSISYSQSIHPLDSSKLAFDKQEVGLNYHETSIHSYESTLLNLKQEVDQIYHKHLTSNSTNLDYVIWLDDNGAGWELYSKTDYLHDSLGRSSGNYISHFIDTDSSWKFSSKRIIKRNQNNLIIDNEAYMWRDYNSYWDKSSRTTREYDNLNNQLLEIEFKGGELDEWQPKIKSDASYNELGNLTNSTSWKWDNNTGSWIKVAVSSKTYSSEGLLISTQYANDYENWSASKQVYKYDDLGNNTRSEYHRGVGDVDNVEWELEYVRLYEYQNKLLVKDSFEYYNQNSQWAVYTNTIKTYKYDQTGNNIEQITYLKSDNGTTLPSSKLDISYNSNSQVTTYINSKMENGSWIGYRKTEYEYDEDFRTISSAFYNDRLDNGDWKGFQKNVYGYDQWGYLIKHDNYHWNNDNNSFYLHRKELCEVNQMGQPTFYIKSFYNLQDGTWRDDEKEIYRYSDEYRILERERYYWSKYENRLKPSYKYVYYYSDLKKQQTVILDSIEHLKYGDTLVLDGSSSSGINVDYHISDKSIASINEDSLFITGIGSFILGASAQGNENFEPADEIRFTLTSEKAEFVIKAEDKEIFEDEELPEATLKLDRFLFEDGIESITLPTVSVDTVNISGPGIYNIMLSGGKSELYELKLQNGVLILKEKPIVLDFKSRLNNYYPNPVKNGQLHLTTDALIDNPICEVYDLEGRFLKKLNVKVIKINKLLISTASIKNGHYLMVIKDSNKDEYVHQQIVIIDN